MDGLAVWLTRFLKNSDASVAGMVAVMPLLHLLVPVSRTHASSKPSTLVPGTHLSGLFTVTTQPSLGLR